MKEKIKIRIYPNFTVVYNQSTVRGKMAAVPCKPKTANRLIESLIFAKFAPVLTTLCMLGLKFLGISYAMNYG